MRKAFTIGNLVFVANLLASYLSDARVSQAEFSRLSEIAPPLISEYVNDNRRPGLDHAFAIERASGGMVPARYWVEVGPIPNAPRTRKAV